VALAAPVLTAQERRWVTPGVVPLYWHLLSLDAPTVAVLWAWAFARAARLPVSPSALAVLGIGTWLIYVADRLLDSRFSPRRHLRERHFFHARHRRPLLAASALAAPLLLWLIAVMPAAARRADTLVFAVSVLYFAGVHLPVLRLRRCFPREVAVGILFALATAIPAWSNPASPHALLIAPVLLFAGLCILNCLAIEVWERAAPSPLSLAIPILAAVLIFASLALLLAPRAPLSAAFEAESAALLSSLLLLALHRLHRRSLRRTSSPDRHNRFLLALRVAADAALLTPILFLLPWHP